MYITHIFHIFQVNIWQRDKVTQYSVLSEKWVQYIDSDTCQKIEPDGFNQYVTFDKFCTNFELGNTDLDSDCSDYLSNYR